LDISQWRREREETGHAELLTWGIEHHQKRFIFLLQKPSQFLVNEPKKIKPNLYPRTPLIIGVITLKMFLDVFLEYRLIYPREEGSSFLTGNI